jgi:hypothetical protein
MIALQTLARLEPRWHNSHCRTLFGEPCTARPIRSLSSLAVR